MRRGKLDTDGLMQRVMTIVFALSFTFWGVIFIWCVVVALAGGSYPWPFSSWSSAGGQLLPAIGFFFGGGLAVLATILVAWVVFALPIMLIARAADRRS